MKLGAKPSVKVGAKLNAKDGANFNAIIAKISANSSSEIT